MSFAISRSASPDGVVVAHAVLFNHELGVVRHKAAKEQEAAVELHLRDAGRRERARRWKAMGGKAHEPGHGDGAQGGRANVQRR